MLIVIIFAVLIALSFVGIFLVLGGLAFLDHCEMLSIAVSDYLMDADNFDISHYQGLTEEEIKREIKRLSDADKRSLQHKCNDNPDFIFDE